MTDTKIIYYFLFLILVQIQHVYPIDNRIQQGTILCPENDNQIEYYLLKPIGEGPFPIMFLLHGYQPPENSPGGKQLVDYGYLNRFEKLGMVAVSISMPGYGQSTGKRDFGGMASQRAIIAMIDYFKTLPFVDDTRMGIYGCSRGAQLAGMVSSQYPGMSLQILDSGFYDLVRFGADAPAYLDRIKDSLIEEGANTQEELIARTPVYHTATTNASTLILQGEFDDRKQLPAAQRLHDQLLKRGVASQLIVYEGECHDLPVDKWVEIISFVRERFFGLYGIGIKVSQPFPALQILKIYPDSPAMRSGKLRIGDAILSISPNDDEQEIPTLRMPVDQFIALLLGRKDTVLRLRIQHFDETIEDVVIRRGSLFILSEM